MGWMSRFLGDRDFWDFAMDTMRKTGDTLFNLSKDEEKIIKE
jgi:hypothetical protein